MAVLSLCSGLNTETFSQWRTVEDTGGQWRRVEESGGQTYRDEHEVEDGDRAGQDITGLVEDTPTLRERPTAC